MNHDIGNGNGNFTAVFNPPEHPKSVRIQWTDSLGTQCCCYGIAEAPSRIASAMRDIIGKAADLAKVSSLPPC